MATAQQQLDAINTAILAIANGKASSYSSGGKSVTYLSLKDLLQLKAELEAQVAYDTENNTSGVEFEEPV